MLLQGNLGTCPFQVKVIFINLIYLIKWHPERDLYHPYCTEEIPALDPVREHAADGLSMHNR